VTISAKDELSLNAYLDGELASIEAANFEQRNSTGFFIQLPQGWSARSLSRLTRPIKAEPFWTCRVHYRCTE